jgi:SnoaL-like domain
VDDAKLTELIDRSEILDLYSQYALGMDRADRELFAGVWSDDAVFECAELGLDARGIEAILEYFDRRPGAAPPAPASGGAIRLSTNQHIVLAGDTATGIAEMAGFRWSGEALYPYSVGIYEDEFVRTAQGWRISHRNMLVTPVVAAPPARIPG